MADGKIYITISDTRGGSNDVATADAEAKSVANNNGKTALGLMAFNKFISLAESQANQYVNYTVGNIGNFTGSYQAQKDAELLLKAINFTTNLGISTVGSFVQFTALSGGNAMVGGIAAAITATIMIGSEIATNVYRENTEAFNMRRTNRNIALMRERLGLEGLTNGSRSGGY